MVEQAVRNNVWSKFIQEEKKKGKISVMKLVQEMRMQ